MRVEFKKTLLGGLLFKPKKECTNLQKLKIFVLKFMQMERSSLSLSGDSDF